MTAFLLLANLGVLGWIVYRLLNGADVAHASAPLSGRDRTDPSDDGRSLVGWRVPEDAAASATLDSTPSWTEEVQTRRP